MVARRKERLEDLAAELGESAHVVAADVTDLEELEGKIEEAARRFGSLDGVITVA
jgi:NADP-dependent 3-hydroxy acid dehydrogenase YdfG